MAVSHISASFNLSVYDGCTFNHTKLGTVSRLPTSNFARNATSFLRGSPLVMQTGSAQLKVAHKAKAASVKCEQSVEISTGKGLLENFGLTSPLPTVALAVTGLVGVLTAVFIF